MRDNIIERMERSGDTVKFVVLSESERHTELLRKLEEEVREFLAVNSADELADIYSVMSALATSIGTTIDIVASLSQTKDMEAGGFGRGLYLISTS